MEVTTSVGWVLKFWLGINPSRHPAWGTLTVRYWLNKKPLDTLPQYTSLLPYTGDALIRAVFYFINFVSCIGRAGIAHCKHVQGTEI